MDKFLNVYGQAAVRIFKKGAFEFGAFRLKLHDKNPKAPLSPFFFNLRDKDNPKPGPLDESDFEIIAKAIWKTVKESGVEFDAIASIPNAGDPIVKALAEVIADDQDWVCFDIRVIELAKTEVDGKRKIIPAEGFEYQKGERVLLVDDLVTQADTKIEAINAIEEFGCVVAGIAVLIDREQGGSTQLKAAGYDLYVAFTITELLDFYRAMTMVSQEKYQEAKEYVAANRV